MEIACPQLDQAIGKQHAMRRRPEMRHPLMRSFEGGEHRAWRYIDEAILQPEPRSR